MVREDLFLLTLKYYLRNEIRSIYTDDKLRALGRYFRQHMQRGQAVFEREYQKIQ